MSTTEIVKIIKAVGSWLGVATVASALSTKQPVDDDENARGLFFTSLGRDSETLILGISSTILTVTSLVLPLFEKKKDKLVM